MAAFLWNVSLDECQVKTHLVYEVFSNKIAQLCMVLKHLFEIYLVSL